MPLAGLNVLKRRGCPLRKYIALCERNSSCRLPDVMKSLSTHILHVYKYDPSISIEIGLGDSSWKVSLLLRAHSRLK
jgi:hypothetical protein